MEISRTAQANSPTTGPTTGPITAEATGPAPALRFAEAARLLGAAAHANGLAVPAFRCPPRTAGVMRSIRRYPGGTVVSVRLRGRPFATVVDDMVEGVLVANRIADPDAGRLRAALHAALGDARDDADDAVPRAA
jgi:hypothetical protein